MILFFKSPFARFMVCGHHLSPLLILFRELQIIMLLTVVKIFLTCKAAFFLHTEAVADLNYYLIPTHTHSVPPCHNFFVKGRFLLWSSDL